MILREIPKQIRQTGRHPNRLVSVSGSARVPRAVFGVAPKISLHKLHLRMNSSQFNEGSGATPEPARATRALPRNSFQPSLQFRRIPRAMENRKDGENVVLDCEIDGVFLEPAQANSLCAATHFLKKLRIGQRTLKRRFYLQFEFFTESGAFAFMPNNRLVEFKPCNRFEDDRKAHCQPNRLLRSASTCSQGIPSRGFFSNSARRQSSSEACSGVRSGSKPFPAMSSHKSCASLMRLSSGSALAAAKTSVALMAAIYSFDSSAQAGVSTGFNSAIGNRQSANFP